MPQLVSRYEPHRLGHSVQRYVLLFLNALPPHLHREPLVLGVVEALSRVVREEQEDVLRQDAALLVQARSPMCPQPHPQVNIGVRKTEKGRQADSSRGGERSGTAA